MDRSRSVYTALRATESMPFFPYNALTRRSPLEKRVGKDGLDLWRRPSCMAGISGRLDDELPGASPMRHAVTADRRARQSSGHYRRNGSGGCAGQGGRSR